MRGLLVLAFLISACAHQQASLFLNPALDSSRVDVLNMHHHYVDYPCVLHVFRSRMALHLKDYATALDEIKLARMYDPRSMLLQNYEKETQRLLFLDQKQ